VEFSTGRSWAEAAALYSRIVDAEIARSDLGKLAQEARGDARGRDAIALRLLRMVNKEVRYVALELGAASLFPRVPAETLKRQYGDCKDQATVLVALLRASGVPANVALLRTGPDYDTDETLPGLDFDHAIVHVPGEPALWIDPTSPLTPFGELPAGDQGRRALIAAAHTTALTTTPRLPSSRNTLIEERQYLFEEEGYGRVIEDTTTTGDFERDYRQYDEDTEPKKARESLEDYAKTVYKAKLDKSSHSEPRDFSRAYKLHVEASGSERAATYDDRAEAIFFPAGVLSQLPTSLRDKPERAEPRRSSYQLHRPHRVEHRYRFVPPPGYAAVDLPPEEHLTLGPMRFDVRFERKPSGEVLGVVSLDTGSGFFDAKTFDEVRDKIDELDKREGLTVRFDSIAGAHFTAGRLKEAIAELMRLAALHPKEARH
jgi:hypothetical protein